MRKSGSLALLIAVLLVPFADVLFRGGTFFYGDTSTHYAPLKALHGSLLRSGFAPTWNAWLQLGEPMAANPSLGVFYPVTALLFLLVAPSTALSLSIVAHVVLLGVGGWVFVQGQGGGRVPWTAATIGIAVALSGVALSYTTNPQYLFTLSWLPWMVHFAWRVGAGGGLRRAAALGGAGALALHAGDPQGAAIGAMVALVVLASSGGGVFGRRRRGAIAFAAVVAVMVATVLAWPAVELLSESRRGAGLSLAEAADWSLHPVRLVTLFLPELFGLPGPENTFWGHPLIIGVNNTRFWFFGISVGLVPWVGLGVWARTRGGVRRVGLGMLAVSALLLLMALGSEGPLFPLAHRHLPMVAAFRYPEKYLAGCAVLIPLAAGLGLAGAERKRCGGGPRGVAVAALVVGIVSIGAAAAVLGPLAGSLAERIGAWALAPNAEAAMAGLRADALQSAGHGGLLLIAAALIAWRPRSAFPILLAVTIAEALPRAGRLIYTTDRSLYDAPTELARGLPVVEGTRPPRLARDARVLDPYPWPRGMSGEREVYGRWKRCAKPNFGLLEGVAYAVGYSGLEGAGSRELARTLSADPAAVAARLATPFLVTAPVVGAPRPVADDLARGALERVALFPRSGAELTRVVDVRAPAELVRSFRFAEGEALPISEAPVTVDTGVSLQGGVVVSGNLLPPAGWDAGDGGEDLVLEEEWWPDRVRVSVPEGERGLLVLRDRFAPGWFAWDDRGKELPILRVDGLFRGVWVEEGIRAVEFVYAPRSLWVGGWITLAGALIAAVSLVMRGNEARRE